MTGDTRLTLQTLMLMTDFEITAGNELRALLSDASKAFTSFMNQNVNTEELSYVALCSEAYLSEEVQGLVLDTVKQKFDEAT